MEDKLAELQNDLIEKIARGELSISDVHIIYASDSLGLGLTLDNWLEHKRFYDEAEREYLMSVSDTTDIKKYIKSLNLDDYGLGGVELVEEDYIEIVRKMKKGLSLKTAVNTELYDIRRVLDEE